MVSKSVASAKKYFSHTLEEDGTRADLTKTTDDMKMGSAAKKEKDKDCRVTRGFDLTLVKPPVTPGQAALAAQQTLMQASRMNRGWDGAIDSFGKSARTSLWGWRILVRLVSVGPWS